MTTPIAYSLATAAEATGLSRSHLERAIRTGHLRAKRTTVDADGKPAGKWVIKAEALTAYVDELVDA